MATVLAIDDDPSMRGMVAEVLTAAGHTVMQAKDGIEALQRLKASAPDLVVTDIVMPGRDGIEMIFGLRRDFPELPVIAMSGFSLNSPLYLKTAKQLGARRVLGKPFTGEALLSAVDEALKK